MILLNIVPKYKQFIVFGFLFFYSCFIAQGPCLYASGSNNEENNNNIENKSSDKKFNCSENVNNILICNGYNYTFPDGVKFENITTDTSQVSLLENKDSTFIRFTTNIKVLPAFYKTIEVKMCKGGNYTFPDGHVYYNILQDTSYTSTVPIIKNGCDSIIETKIIVKELKPPRINFIKEL